LYIRAVASDAGGTICVLSGFHSITMPIRSGMCTSIIIMCLSVRSFHTFERIR
jgi:hypothetical protein